MKTPTFLGYAEIASNAEQVAYEQEQFLRQFLGSASTPAVHPASIRMETDGADGVVRRWPDRRTDLPTPLTPAMASSRSAAGLYGRGIEFRRPAVDQPVFPELSIDVVALDFGGPPPEELRRAIAGRYVLIGGDINDIDDYETPMSRFSGKTMKGVEVHAHMLAQLLDGRIPAALPGWLLWLAAAATVAAGGLTSLLEMRSWKLPAALAAQALILGGLPFLLQDRHVETIGLPAFGWGLGWALAFAAVGTAARAVGSEQRRFAQATLGKYLPADVAAEILKNPDRLTLTGEKRQIYALFSDLEGFTKLSHAIPPERLSSLLNAYLDLLSEIVLRHGGTIDKFVGDAVVAFWGAPLAREDDADRAVLAAIAMADAGEQFRRLAGADIPPIGRTRVGLHRGEAVVGNFGGEGRIQYTALGDGMNTAARLESANKQLHSALLVSDEAKRETGLDIFRPLGRVVLSGRATPVEVWEPVPHMDAELRRRLNALWLAFESGDGEALGGLEAIAAETKDEALAYLVYRLREAGPGGHYVLGSK
jgi:adenylate cyclase